MDCLPHVDCLPRFFEPVSLAVSRAVAHALAALGRPAGDGLEDAKRAQLVQPRPGEGKLDAAKAVHADLDDHDALNARLFETHGCFGSSGQRGWQELPAASSDGPPRLALLFLVVGRLKNEEWWRKWLRQADEDGHRDHYRIVFHRGGAYGQDADAISDDILAERGLPVWPPTKTGWARSGLVRATLLLLRFALEDPGSRWFVLLSDSCMPLFSFRDLYARMCQQRLSRFHNFGMTIDVGLQRNMWQEQTCKSKSRAHKADQWALWVRDDAEWFVKENHLRKLKARTVFVDEPYFINMMDEHKRPYENGWVTYTRWYHQSDTPGCGSQARHIPFNLGTCAQCLSSPHTFQRVDIKEVRRVRNRGCWFMRKIDKGARYPSVEEL